ncbi:MAG TPA: hypothetical protein VMD56_10050 [Steroidobacteraceae bacterium]|nr:hypothetical protein [Steroidobacteraceae bacterium]
MGTSRCRAAAFRGLVLAVAGMVCGCAALGAPTQKGYDEALQTWVGEPTSDLTSRWGQPDNRYLGPNGGLILQYTRSSASTTNLQPAHQNFAEQTSGTQDLHSVGGSNAGAEEFRSLAQQSLPAQQVTHTCTTRFITDSGGIIRQFQSAGDACRAEEPQNGHWGPSAQPLLSPHATTGG